MWSKIFSFKKINFRVCFVRSLSQILDKLNIKLEFFKNGASYKKFLFYVFYFVNHPFRILELTIFDKFSNSIFSRMKHLSKKCYSLFSTHFYTWKHLSDRELRDTLYIVHENIRTAIVENFYVQCLMKVLDHLSYVFILCVLYRLYR